MRDLRPEDLVRRYPDRDFLIAEGGAGAPYMLAMHRAFYRYVSGRLGEGERVLDAGCGTGIGTELLAGGDRIALGVDVKPPVLRYAAARHHDGRPLYAAMDAVGLVQPYEGSIIKGSERKLSPKDETHKKHTYYVTTAVTDRILRETVE